MTRLKTMTLRLAAAAGSLALLAGCAASPDAAPRADAPGFEYGANQATVDAAIADLDPVRLVYQPTAQSPRSASAASGRRFMEAVKERSGGRIEIVPAWGQSISPYGEIDESLNDGRLDISFDVLTYSPEEYPEFDAIASVSQLAPGSSLVGETAMVGELLETADANPAVRERLRAKGLDMLTPMVNAGGYYLSCRHAIEGIADWDGLRVRIGTRRQRELVESLGGVALSMQYTEAYEALQRGALDCALNPLTAIGGLGINEVAPYFYTWSEHSAADAGTSAHLYGEGVKDLPLPYRQIIFDANVDYLQGHLEGIAVASQNAVGQAKKAGGAVGPLPADVEQALTQTSRDAMAGLVAEGLLRQEDVDRAGEAARRWQGAAQEAGVEDRGPMSEITSWYTEEDFRPIAQRMFDEILADDRPAG
ncbi:hypothetical protein ACH0BW_05945 [Micrococcus luteus]|uniref:hypothetical protein n=1 Tax=Micrococcus luteus TaxID=1270 RepID=UPI00387A4AC4